MSPVAISRKEKPRKRRSIPIVLLLILAAAMLGGCSQRVLTFFFTGVPDPNQQVEPVETAAAVADTAVEDAAQSGYWVPEQNYFAHGPWASKQCDGCHLADAGRRYNTLMAAAPSMVRLAYDEAELCVSCHAQQQFIGGNEESWLHGPVANRQCRTCHNPHNSPRRYMLKEESNKELCGQCHRSTDLRKTRLHIEQPDSDCIACHNPHAGSTSMLLRAGIAR